MAPVTYRSFLSYSHADQKWAKWLHTRLEHFKVDKDLIGRLTVHGRVPDSLYPIFRDRFEFGAGDTLLEQTRTAIDNSGSLIVICSAHAARSKYVDQEIALFRVKHPERPIIPVIVSGSPGSGGDIDLLQWLRSAADGASVSGDSRIK